MKPILALTFTLLALLSRIPSAHAATQLVWRTPPGGIAVARGERLTVTTVDLSAYDRVRVIVASRGNDAATGPRLPASIRLFVGEGDILALFDTLTPLLDTTSALGAGGAVVARPDRDTLSWGVTRLYSHPVIRTMAVVAVGDEFFFGASPRRVSLDVLIYGETASQ
jgi:hypothetical protein